MRTCRELGGSRSRTQEQMSLRGRLASQVWGQINILVVGRQGGWGVASPSEQVSFPPPPAVRCYVKLKNNKECVRGK